MLSDEENELLTRTGRGTPMGNLLRQYWLPALLTEELPDADGNPVRVRLLSEDLVAFRDTAGRVGLVGDHCPHRGASLYFGRNEASGLRCVYHGWKFDVGGTCVDMPNEPPESNFKDKVHHQAYQCQERGGVIWTYLGDGVPPELPALEWNLVPPSHVYASKRFQETNFMQGLEGDLDSSHTSFLHGTLNENEFRPYGAAVTARSVEYNRRDKHPHFELMDTPGGVVVAARRQAEEDTYYWRFTQFMLPVYTMIPPRGEDPPINGKAWVPIDDENHMNWTWTWHPTRPLNEKELANLRLGETAHVPPEGYLPETPEAGSRWRTKANQANDYLIDREAQRTRLFSGLPGNWGQDGAMQESMGAIYRRSAEHLGSSDAAVIRVRRRLMQAARALAERGECPLRDASAYAVRPTAVVLPRSMPWAEGVEDRLQARAGVYHPGV